MRAEALEYSRAMESRCREELARMEVRVTSSLTSDYNDVSQTVAQNA